MSDTSTKSPSSTVYHRRDDRGFIHVQYIAEGAGRSVLVPHADAFKSGAWVAQFDSDPDRPQIAQVRDAYPDPLSKGELLLDLVFFAHDGTRQGRLSPACGGPRNFEPACDASRWVLIHKPDFERLASTRHAWGAMLNIRELAGALADRAAAADKLLSEQGAVYPGHPVTLAYLIMRQYKSLADARQTDGQYPSALTNQAIPGGGGSVHAALDLLARAEIVGIEQALAYGDRDWMAFTETAYLDRRQTGQDQADVLKPLLLEQYAGWGLNAVPSTMS